MVRRQNTPPKLERLILHHQSILVPSKCSVRDGKIVHCGAWSRERQPPPQSINHKIIKSHRTYVRMVRRQITPQKLKSLLLHHQSILVPSKCSVRASETAHCGAWSRERQPPPQSNNHKITSHLCPDGSPAEHAAETRAQTHASPEHLGAVQVKCT